MGDMTWLWAVLLVQGVYLMWFARECSRLRLDRDMHRHARRFPGRCLICDVGRRPHGQKFWTPHECPEIGWAERNRRPPG